MANDRGDFGMPTLGSTGAGFDVMHPPYPAPAKGNRVDIDHFTIRRLDNYTVIECAMHDHHIRTTTKEASHILSGHLLDWIEGFLEKNRKYASVQTGHNLGTKGEIPDLNRKMAILVDRIWKGNAVIGEDNVEVIHDMIGHLFLLLCKIEEES